MVVRGLVRLFAGLVCSGRPQFIRDQQPPNRPLYPRGVSAVDVHSAAENTQANSDSSHAQRSIQSEARMLAAQRTFSETTSVRAEPHGLLQSTQQISRT